MFKRKFFKYDIVMSFTEKDAEVAHKMNKALRRKGLSVYYYKDKNQLGQDLKETTPYYYGDRTNYGLVILSRAYSHKNWPQKEWNAMLKAKRKGIIKGIFVVRVEKTSLPGMSQSIIQSKWNNNAKEIAKQIKQQIGFSGTRIVKVLWLLIIIGLIYAGYSYINKIVDLH